MLDYAPVGLQVTWIHACFKPWITWITLKTCFCASEADHAEIMHLCVQHAALASFVYECDDMNVLLVRCVCVCELRSARISPWEFYNQHVLHLHQPHPLAVTVDYIGLHWITLDYPSTLGLQ